MGFLLDHKILLPPHPLCWRVCDLLFPCFFFLFFLIWGNRTITVLDCIFINIYFYRIFLFVQIIPHCLLLFRSSPSLLAFQTRTMVLYQPYFFPFEEREGRGEKKRRGESPKELSHSKQKEHYLVREWDFILYEFVYVGSYPFKLNIGSII